MSTPHMPTSRNLPAATLLLLVLPICQSWLYLMSAQTVDLMLIPMCGSKLARLAAMLYVLTLWAGLAKFPPKDFLNRLFLCRCFSHQDFLRNIPKIS